MERYNSFNLIHKALRAMLYDAALTLQHTYFAEADEAEAALATVEQVIENFDNHAYHEDSFILPAIQTFAPEVVEEFEKEHVEDVLLGNRLKTLINIYRSCSGNAERINCGSSLCKSFREFLVFNLNHMAKEEIEINQILWKHYTDEELMHLHNKLTASIPAEEKMMSAAWMMRSINKAEAISWLKTVKKTAPSFVFEALYQLTETYLPKTMRSEVQDAVMDAEFVF